MKIPITTVKDLIKKLEQLAPHWAIGITVNDGLHTTVHVKNVHIVSWVGRGKDKSRPTGGYAISAEPD